MAVARTCAQECRNLSTSVICCLVSGDLRSSGIGEKGGKYTRRRRLAREKKPSVQVLSFEFSLGLSKAILEQSPFVGAHRQHHEKSEGRHFWSERLFRRGTGEA